MFMRLARSLFTADSVRAFCYVDDPLFLVLGSPLLPKRHNATCILVWEALGFGFQYRIGEYGPAVGWIGGSFVISITRSHSMRRTVHVVDVQQLFNEFLGRNHVSRTELLSITGKANHAADLLFTLRPF